MKVSIITVTYNSEKYLKQTIISVFEQNYKNIEYIIIDGGSTDGTIDIINKYKTNINYFISESDKGIYDAMNKGIKIATGDIIGFLNSDDIYYDKYVVNNIVNEFTNNIDCLYGNIYFVDSNNTNKIIRNYSGKNFSLNQFAFGHMPPHPSFYALKKLYNVVGFFKIGYKIAADFDYLIRALIINKAKYKYINLPFVKMRTGGVSSTIKNKILLNQEIFRSCNENMINTNYIKIYSKYFIKLFSYFKNN